MDEQLTKVRNEVQQLLSYDGSGHNIDHIDRVYALAMYIASKEGGDVNIIGLSAYLHDVDDEKLPHSVKGEYIHAKHLMTVTGIDLPIQQQVLEVISQVSYTKQMKGTKTTSLEAMIVQDADRLDAIGAIGIARTFAFGGAHQRSLFERIDHSSHQHFYDKLIHIKDLINTHAARIIAKKRHRFLLQYLKTLERELKQSKR
jgi:uncharacterized protein